MLHPKLQPTYSSPPCHTLSSLPSPPPPSAQVEMFVVCTPEQSEAMHQQLLELEVQMFTELGLHFQVGCKLS